MSSVTSEILMCTPSSWSWPDFTENYKLKQVATTESVYYRVKSKVSGDFNLGTSGIYRVESPFLFAQYMLKKAEYESRGSVQTLELYHDTGASKIPSILSTNLDWRLAVRVKYGYGVSFSPSPSYANKESSRQNGSERAMIVADVLVGREEYVYGSKHVPAAGKDTTIGNSGQVYVKYNDDEFYPKFIVFYTNKPRFYRGRLFY